MGSKKTTTTSKETAVTTPNTPDYIQAPVNDYYAGVSNFLKTPASAMVTPANSLQNTVYSRAANLGSTTGDFATALRGVGGLMGSTSTLAQSPAILNAATAQTGLLGNAPQASTTAATTATLADPTAASAASAGKAAQVGLLGYNPTTAGSRGYDASLIGDTGGLLPANARSIASASLLDGLDKYMDPATDALVSATLAKYDDATGQQRAALARSGAAAGAFGGSRYGLAQGQFESDSLLNRALTDAQLRTTAFDRATNMSNLDAGRRQDADTFNANAANALDLNRGQFKLQGLLADQTSRNDAARFGADAYNQTEKFNAGALNDAGQFNAGERNKGLLFNADATNSFAQSDADRRQQTGLLNTQALNDFATRRFDAANENERLNASEANATARSNADRAGQFDLARYDAENRNSEFNAGQRNDINSMMYQNDADNSRFNANLGLQDRQLSLDAASRYADILGAQNDDERANLAAMLGIGDAQWESDNRATQAELQKLLAAGGLLDPQMMAALTGQTITSDGNSTSKQSGGLLSGILSGAFGLGAAAIGKSERRVKRDIALVGREPDGLGVYDFRYVWDDDASPLRRGTMVDEVEQLRPWALGPVVDGVQTVNYGAL